MTEDRKRRNTKQRDLVLKTVRSAQFHPTADEIYALARNADPRISRGTVYRNLKLLSDAGEINHIKVPAADRFDFRTDLHYHILCTDCGRVFDSPIEYRNEIDDETERATEFRIVRHRTVFEGLCKSCLEKA